MDAMDMIAPTRNILRDYPTKRVMPYDGMAVTAEVWEDALAHTRRLLHYHALLQHGHGIVAGLEVVASDPSDTSVYIRPGAAVSPSGALIVITEPVLQPVGADEGMAHLVLVYAESEPAYERSAGGPGDRLWVNSGYYVEVMAELPDGPCVELARVRRSSKTASVYNAGNPLHPGDDEIDMRIRREIGPALPVVAGAGIVHFGNVTCDDTLRGMDALSRSLKRAGVNLWVDDQVSPAGPLDGFDLLYAVGHGEFQMTADEMTALYHFVQNGGLLVTESCRREANAEKSDAAFRDMFESMGLTLEEARAGHPLLSEPHLFAAAPEGFEEAPALLATEGVVFSTADYLSAWQGLRKSGAASREVIRAAHEWGENLVRMAASRRAQFGRIVPAVSGDLSQRP
jgi:hypothetical protein